MKIISIFKIMCIFHFDSILKFEERFLLTLIFVVQ